MKNVILVDIKSYTLTKLGSDVHKVYDEYQKRGKML